MRLVKNNVLKFRFKPKGENKKKQDEIDPVIHEELMNTQMRPAKLSSKMAFKTQSILPVVRKERKKPWKTEFVECWKILQEQQLQQQNQNIQEL